MTSNEYVKQLIKLSEENPELEVKASIDRDCHCGEDYPFYMANIGSSEIDEYWEADEEVIVGENQILDHIRYILDGSADFPCDFDEQEKKIQEYYCHLQESGKIETAIFVNITI